MNRSFELPAELARLIETGCWPTTPEGANAQNLLPLFPPECVAQLVPSEHAIFFYPPPFHTLSAWLHSDRARIECASDTVVPDKLLILGDFGAGSDTLFALDYSGSESQPPVVRLQWNLPNAPNRWVQVEPSFAEFWGRLEACAAVHPSPHPPAPAPRSCFNDNRNLFALEFHHRRAATLSASRKWLALMVASLAGLSFAEVGTAPLLYHVIFSAVATGLFAAAAARMGFLLFAHYRCPRCGRVPKSKGRFASHWPGFGWEQHLDPKVCLNCGALLKPPRPYPRKHSVQAQNLVQQEAIRATARSVRDHPERVPWLADVLASRNLRIADGIAASLNDIPDQEGIIYYCTWISHPGRFWEIEAVISYSGQFLGIERFEEITDQIEISDHLKGRGRSFGSLALEILREFVPRSAAVFASVPKE